MPDTLGLEFVHRSQLDMGPGSFHYIAVKTFRSQADRGEAQVLEALIEHRHFRDDYVGYGSYKRDSGDRHGPYHLDRISIDSFRPVNEGFAEKLVRAYADRFELPADQEDALERTVMTPIRCATALYRLRNLEEDAHHESGHILDDFHELVALNRRNGDAALIILCGD